MNKNSDNYIYYIRRDILGEEFPRIYVDHMSVILQKEGAIYMILLRYYTNTRISEQCEYR